MSAHLVDGGQLYRALRGQLLGEVQAHRIGALRGGVVGETHALNLSACRRQLQALRRAWRQAKAAASWAAWAQRVGQKAPTRHLAYLGPLRPVALEVCQ